VSSGQPSFDGLVTSEYSNQLKKTLAAITNIDWDHMEYLGDTVEALEIKQKAADGRCHVDVGFWGGVVPGNTRQLEPLARAGALGFKCFLSPSGVDEFLTICEHRHQILGPVGAYPAIARPAAASARNCRSSSSEGTASRSEVISSTIACSAASSPPRAGSNRV